MAMRADEQHDVDVTSSRKAVRDVLLATSATSASPLVLKLNTLCSMFKGEISEDAFYDTFASDAKEDPVVEICMTINKDAQLPNDTYSFLQNRQNKAPAEINKSSGKSVKLAIRRDTETPPITAVCYVLTHLGEEPPVGFTSIASSVEGQPANVHAGSPRSLYLATSRGRGPHIRSLALSYSDHDSLPRAFFRVERSPRGRSANLSRDDATQTVHLAYSLDFHEYINRFRNLCPDRSVLSKCVACLCLALFSHDRKVVRQAVGAFEVLPPLPRDLVSAFGNALCDSLSLYVSYFGTDYHTEHLKSLRSFFRSNATSLDRPVVMRIMQACMLLRHEDYRLRVSFEIIDGLLDVIPACRQRLSLSGDKNSAAPNGVKHSDSKQTLNSHGVNGVEKSTQADHSGSEATPSSSDVLDRRRKLIESLVRETADSVVLNKMCRNSIGVFMRRKFVDETFRETMDEFIGSLFSNHVESLLISVLVVLSKIVSEPLPDVLSTKSERIKRGVHALGVLSYVLERVPHFLQSRPEAVLILRRIFCTSFAENLTSWVPPLFQISMKFFAYLWMHYIPVLKHELGVMLEECLMGMLSSPYCTPVQKIDIVEGISHLVCSPQALADIYYNYDNDFNSSNLFETTIKLISSISQGEHAANKYDYPEEDLRRATLAFLLNCVEFLHGWLTEHRSHRGDSSRYSLSSSSSNNTESSIAISHVSMSSRNSTPVSTMTPTANLTPASTGNSTGITPVSTSSSTQSSGSSVAQRFTPAPPPQPFSSSSTPPPTLPHANSNSTSEALSTSQSSTNGPSSTPPRLGRMSTWEGRFETQKTQADLENSVLKVAESKSVSKAMKYLWENHPSPTLPGVAKFLYGKAELDKHQVGEFIGYQVIKELFNEKQMNELRREYVALLDFTSMSFDEALRHFLVDSNFRIPGEAQKIDRILMAFSERFHIDNPGTFETPNGAYVTSFAILMLNTDLHDSRLRSGTSSRRKMTKAEFVRNLSDVEKIPQEFLESQYDAIARREIKWKEEDLNATPDGIDTSAFQQSFHEECRKFTHKCHASLRLRAILSPSFSRASNKDLAKGLFSCSWFPILVAFTNLLQKSKDMEILGACLDGLKFGSLVALKLGAVDELVSYANILAQFIFSETNRKRYGAEIPRRISKGEHQQVPWFKTLKTNAVQKPAEVAKLICSLANDTKSRVLYSQNQDALKKIEQDFGGEIVLAHPDREFLRTGSLKKVNSSGKPQEYQFFLFTDFILYASNTYSSFKYHRALHLSLCKVVDVRDSKSIQNGWKILSPQKSVTLFADSPQQKHEWVEALSRAIHDVQEHRRLWVREKALSSSSGSSAITELKYMSQFLGRAGENLFSPSGDKNEGAASGTSSKSSTERNVEAPDKLCLRPFGVLRRRFQCAWCEDDVCKQCSTRSIEIPPARKKKRVCDACYGFLRSNTSLGRAATVRVGVNK